MSKIAVLISDIHFNINNLGLASKSLEAALTKAEELQVPLIIAGDLNDTKAIIRAEVANALITILSKARVQVYILEGNHDKINEKGIGHGLNYLAPYSHIIDAPQHLVPSLLLIPYYSDADQLLAYLKTIRSTVTMIMHQGFRGAFLGDYVQDKTSIEVSAVERHRVFSGHYHRHQTLGTVTYIGSPYTITFGEANDGPKGFLSISADGSFERHILTLRRHVIISLNTDDLDGPKIWPISLSPEDLLWLKISGPKSELDKLSKQEIADKYVGHSNFKLEKIPNESEKLEKETKQLTDVQIFDSLIDSLSDTDEHKAALKALWRDLVS